MIRRALVALACLVALAAVSPAPAETGIGHPFPALASECTPAMPGLGCPNDDALGVGRVEMYSGEYFLEEEDLRVPGRGFDFVMRRYYRSRGQRIDPDAFANKVWRRPHSDLGGAWDFSYNLRLESYRDYAVDFFRRDWDTYIAPTRNTK